MMDKAIAVGLTSAGMLTACAQSGPEIIRVAQVSPATATSTARCLNSVDLVDGRITEVSVTSCRNSSKAYPAPGRFGRAYVRSYIDKESAVPIYGLSFVAKGVRIHDPKAMTLTWQGKSYRVDRISEATAYSTMCGGGEQSQYGCRRGLTQLTLNYRLDDSFMADFIASGGLQGDAEIRIDFEKWFGREFTYSIPAAELAAVYQYMHAQLQDSKTPETVSGD